MGYYEQERLISLTPESLDKLHKKIDTETELRQRYESALKEIIELDGKFGCESVGIAREALRVGKSGT